MYIYNQTYTAILIHVQTINAFCFIPKMKPKFLQTYGHNTLLRRKECIWKSKEASNIIQHINILMLTQCLQSFCKCSLSVWMPKPCNKKNSLYIVIPTSVNNKVCPTCWFCWVNYTPSRPKPTKGCSADWRRWRNYTPQMAP